MKFFLTFLLYWSSAFSVAAYADERDPAEAIIDCEGEAASTQFCLDKEEAFELRARIEVFYPKLKAIPSPPWSEEDFSGAEDSYNDGVQLYREQYYGDAIKKFETALESLQALDDQFQIVAADKRAAIDDYFVANEYETAVMELTALTEWFPDDKDLIELLVDATRGRSLIPIVEMLQSYLSNEEFDDAQRLLENFPKGYFEQEIAAARQSLEDHKRLISFNSVMTESYNNVNNQNWLLAKQNVEAALLIYPNSAVAKNLLEHITESLRREQVTELNLEIFRAERAERWEDALVMIQEIKKLDDQNETDLSTLEAELNALVKFDSELSKYASMDFADLNSDARTEIQEFLDNTDHLNEFDRTRPKRVSLEDRFSQYNTPVEVKILSDKVTTIRIRPGAEIGSFRSKTLEILPGTYEVIGTRRGFKQVIQKLVIKPNSEPLEIKVECRVRF